jgi:hypothetical protein
MTEKKGLSEKCAWKKSEMNAFFAVQLTIGMLSLSFLFEKIMRRFHQHEIAFFHLL